MEKLNLSPALRLSLLYAIAAGLWILFSDKLLEIFLRAPHTVTAVQTYKGWAFVALTSTLLYFLIRRELRAKDRERNKRRSAEGRMNSILEMAGDAIIFLDSEYRLIRFNRAAERIFGYPAATVLKQPFEGLLAPISLETHQQRLRDTAAQPAGTSQYYEVVARRQDGTEFPAEVSLAKAQQDGESSFAIIVRDITQRRQTDRALRSSEELLRQLAENIREVFFVRDLTTYQIVYISPAYEEIWGCSRESLYENPTGFLDAVHPEDRQQVIAAMEREKRGEFLSLEYRIVPREGEIRWIWIRLFPIFNEIGAVYRVAGIAEDISDRKQTEETLQKANEQLEIRVRERTTELTQLLEQLNGEIEQRQQAEAAMQARSRYLAVLVELQRRLLGTPYRQPDRSSRSPNPYDPILEILGPVSGATRVLVFENHRDVTGRLFADRQAEWYASGFALPNPGETVSPVSPDFEIPRWTEILSNGEIITAIVAELPDSERVVLDAQGVLSVLVLPAIVDGEFFGFIRFDNCTEARVWEPSEIDLLRAAAAAICLHKERMKAEVAVRESEKRYRQIVETVDDGIWVTDPEGQTTFVNHKMADMLGYQVDEMQQQPFWVFVDPESLAKLRLNVENQSPGIRQARDIKFKRRDGSDLWAIVSSTPLWDEEERYTGTLSTIADISDRKQNEEKTRTNLEKERELGELKSRFVTTASHEFRTPLTTILSSAELLQHYGYKWSDDKKLHHLQRIQNSVKYMTQLLNDILIVGQAEAGKISFNPQSVELLKLCEELVESIKLIHSKNHTITFSYEGDFTQVLLDEILLEQILRNLLTNAIKYSPKGGDVSLTLRCQKLEDRNQGAQDFSSDSSTSLSPDVYTLDTSEVVIFHIRDTGMGIPPEDRATLFAPFHRAGNAANIPGTGLGLAIVKNAVDLHRGAIAVESEVGVGTTFTVTLPLTRL